MLDGLEGVIQADHRGYAAPEAGAGEGEQHAARNEQVACEIELDPAGTKQQSEIARSGSELVERDRRRWERKDSRLD